jgi:hypothetical protein
LLVSAKCIPAECAGEILDKNGGTPVATTGENF